MSSIKALTRRLLNLVEALEGSYSDVYYNADNIDQLLKDKSITAIKGLSTYGANITQFPMQVTYIAEQCNIFDDKITKLPDNLTVGHALQISRGALMKLPKGLNVGSLSIYNNNTITELPNDLEIKDILELVRCSVKRIENISCKKITIRDVALNVLKNIHVNHIRMTFHEDQSFTVYPDVEVSDGIYTEYIDNQGNQSYEKFSDAFDLYEKYPQFAPEDYFIDYSDEDME